MKDLNYQLKRLCYDNRQGSYATQVARRYMLNQMADQLHEMGYRGMGLRSLKPKHVEALVERWLKEDLKAGTIKNRMHCLRWWAGKVNRANVVARSNAHHGIPDRQFVTEGTKAQELVRDKLEQVRDAHVRMSLELQQAFGLRREEAIKFQPVYADQGDYIRLKQSWTKGGKARMIPIRNAHQREVLERTHRLVGKASLIPGCKNYIQQLRTYERQTANAHLSKMHGLRHAYAQDRYFELTGRPSPAAGGPKSTELNGEQKRVDATARLLISKELGHDRAQILTVYCGR